MWKYLSFAHGMAENNHKKLILLQAFWCTVRFRTTLHNLKDYLVVAIGYGMFLLNVKICEIYKLYCEP